MGREAECACEWSGESTQVNALLESGELILRGGLRRRIPFARIAHVQVDHDKLAFTVDGQPVALSLGAATAESWAKQILQPAPTLAKKLGITPATTVWLLGEPGSALQEALDSAKAVSHNQPDLIVARIDTPSDLHAILRRTHDHTTRKTPLWIVYPKGKGHEVNETMIRSAARELGLIDTKVAAVSPTLAALRFIVRK